MIVCVNFRIFYFYYIIISGDFNRRKREAQFCEAKQILKQCSQTIGEADKPPQGGDNPLKTDYGSEVIISYRLQFLN